MILEIIANNINIPTPLALGGLVVSGLIAVFLAILKLKIFPRLNQELGERTISRLMLYLFILALVGMILGFFGYILPIILNSSNASNSNAVNNTSVVNISREFKYEWILREAIKDVAQKDGRIANISSNCSDSFMSTKLNKGTLQAPSVISLISQLQKNLSQPNSAESYKVELIEGVYEIKCEKN